MEKQFVFGLVPVDRFFGDVNEQLRQPTGEQVEVAGDDGNPVIVDVYWGGSTSVGDVIDGWLFALLFSTPAGIAALRALDGAPALEVATMTEGWPELDSAMSGEAWAKTNDWLEEQGLTPLPAGATQHDAVDLIGLYFQPGFDEMNYMPG